MDYTKHLESILLRYPKQSAKVYIDPEVCNCDKGMLCNFDTDMIEVEDPNEADCIPIWIDYSSKISKNIIDKYINKYPEKCTNVVNFIEQLNEFCPECDNESLNSIIEMLQSPDWESIYCGLNVLRTFKMNDKLANIVKTVIDTFRNEPELNTGSVIPYPNGNSQNSSRVIIHDLSLIKFYHLWLHNKFINYD